MSEKQKPEPCGCRTSDSWRCAEDLGLRNTVSCHCICHRRPLPSPSAEARRECANCPEPESVHGIGGYYCEFKAMPTPAPSPSVEREVEAALKKMDCDCSAEHDREGTEPGPCPNCIVKAAYRRLREELALVRGVLTAIELDGKAGSYHQACINRERYEKAESELAQAKKELSDNQIVLDANRLLGGGSSLYDGYTQARKDLEEMTRERDEARGNYHNCITDYDAAQALLKAKTEECVAMADVLVRKTEECERLVGLIERTVAQTEVTKDWTKLGDKRASIFSDCLQSIRLILTTLALAPRAEKPKCATGECNPQTTSSACVCRTEKPCPCGGKFGFCYPACPGKPATEKPAGEPPLTDRLGATWTTRRAPSKEDLKP